MVDTLEVIAGIACNRLSTDRQRNFEDESAAYDCSAHPGVFTIIANWTVRADRKEEKRKAISKGEDRP